MWSLTRLDLRCVAISILHGLFKASHLSTPIMSDVETNLFFANRNITDLIFQAYCELNKISVQFKANKVSLNEGKINYIIFPKKRQKEKKKRFAIKASKSINGSKTERVDSLKFVSMIFNENIFGILIYSSLRTKYQKILESFTWHRIC